MRRSELRKVNTPSGKVFFRGRPQLGYQERRPEMSRIMLAPGRIRSFAGRTRIITGSLTNCNSGSPTVPEAACEFPQAARVFDWEGL
jgi:hypothetical protein